MFDIGRVCLKLAGRDAGQKCVVVDVLEGKYVLIDGMTRRRKCNTLHLEPLTDKLEITKNASHQDVAREFKKLGFDVVTTKPKQKLERSRAVRKSASKPEQADKKKTDKSQKDSKKAAKK